MWSVRWASAAGRASGAGPAELVHSGEVDLERLVRHCRRAAETFFTQVRTACRDRSEPPWRVAAPGLVADTLGEPLADLARRLRAAAADIKSPAERHDLVSLADTVGYADPVAVASLFERARAIAGDRLAAAHFHDTLGLGAANAYAAWSVGVRAFDGSVGGIGGCPHAPGASGNVATEDLAYLFASMGAPTALDVDALLALRGRIAGWLDGEPLHGAIWRAGLPKSMPGAAAATA